MKCRGVRFGSYVCVASASMSVFRAIEEGKGFQFSSRNLINIIFVRRSTKTWSQYFTCGGYADCVLFAQRLSCGLISLMTIVSSPHHEHKVWNLLEHMEQIFAQLDGGWLMG
jgi:heme exporter protein D